MKDVFIVEKTEDHGAWSSREMTVFADRDAAEKFADRSWCDEMVKLGEVADANRFDTTIEKMDGTSVYWAILNGRMEDGNGEV